MALPPQQSMIDHRIFPSSAKAMPASTECRICLPAHDEIRFTCDVWRYSAQAVQKGCPARPQRM